MCRKWQTVAAWPSRTKKGRHAEERERAVLGALTASIIFKRAPLCLTVFMPSLLERETRDRCCEMKKLLGKDSFFNGGSVELRIVIRRLTNWEHFSVYFEEKLFSVGVFFIIML